MKQYTYKRQVTGNYEVRKTMRLDICKDVWYNILCNRYMAPKLNK